MKTTDLYQSVPDITFHIFTKWLRIAYHDLTIVDKQAIMNLSRIK
jgi:hypothetical protein